MVILGIDPGYAIVGWGVLEYQETALPSADMVRSLLRREWIFLADSR